MNFDPAAEDYEGPLLIIVDEAKSVPGAIFDALDRCGANVFMYTSSPGIRAGRFYRSHTKLARDFIGGQAGLEDCPHIPRAKMMDIIRTHYKFEAGTNLADKLCNPERSGRSNPYE